MLAFSTCSLDKVVAKCKNFPSTLKFQIAWLVLALSRQTSSSTMVLMFTPQETMPCTFATRAVRTVNTSARCQWVRQGTTSRMYLFRTRVLGHSQAHNTRHGSMEQTSWAIEGGDDATREVQGHKFAIGDSGAPMLCSMFCRELGRRHTHVGFCRSKDPKICADPGVEHITQRMEPRAGVAKDWITHSLYWARSGKHTSDLPHGCTLLC